MRKLLVTMTESAQKTQLRAITCFHAKYRQKGVDGVECKEPPVAHVGVTRRFLSCHHHMANGNFHSVSLLVKWEGSSTLVFSSPPLSPAAAAVRLSVTLGKAQHLRLIRTFPVWKRACDYQVNSDHHICCLEAGGLIELALPLRWAAVRASALIRKCKIRWFLMALETVDFSFFSSFACVTCICRCVCKTKLNGDLQSEPFLLGWTAKHASFIYVRAFYFCLTVTI